MVKDRDIAIDRLYAEFNRIKGKGLWKPDPEVVLNFIDFNEFDMTTNKRLLNEEELEELKKIGNRTGIVINYKGITPE